MRSIDLLLENLQRFLDIPIQDKMLTVLLVSMTFLGLALLLVLFILWKLLNSGR